MKFWVQSGVRKSLSAGVLCIAVALLTSHFSLQTLPQLQEGDIATQDVEATVDFDYIDEEAWERQKSIVATEQPSIFKLDVSKQITLSHRINSAFITARQSLVETPSELHQIQETFADALGLQVRPEEEQAFIESKWSVDLQQATLKMLEESMQFYIIDIASEIPSAGEYFEVQRQFELGEDSIMLNEVRNVKTLVEVQQYVPILASNLTDYPEEIRSLAIGIVRSTLQVNFTYDHAKTEQVRFNKASATPPVIRHVNRGQSIVRKGDRVDEAQAAVLSALFEHHEGGWSGFWGEFATKLGFSGFIVLSLYAFATQNIRRFMAGVKEIEAMTLLGLLVLMTARLLVFGSLSLSEMVGMGMGEHALWYVTPMAAGALVMRVITNAETTLIWSVGMACVLAFGMEQDVFFAAFFLLSGVMAAMSLSSTRDRINLLRAGLQTGLLTAAVALMIEYYRIQMDTTGLGVPSQPLWDVFFSVMGGITSAFIALGLLPLFEMMGFVTDYKMLELANLNHPMLRQLFLRAPGTYHHSMVMAQLSEAAAEKIGANALHVKIACYYHDIGKSLQPHFFIENQRGSNPHDNLQPHQSARVIRTHVIDGLVMAKQHDLPQPILDAIEMHHGTTVMKYFYVKALEQAVEGEEVLKEDFQYFGKRPNTREAGIIFLADRVEAACRTLKNPGPDDFEAMIRNLINDAIAEGQLDECPLTLKELKDIIDVFKHTMTSMYHQRIEYPEMPKDAMKSSVITLETRNPLLNTEPTPEIQSTKVE